MSEAGFVSHKVGVMQHFGEKFDIAVVPLERARPRDYVSVFIEDAVFRAIGNFE